MYVEINHMTVVYVINPEVHAKAHVIVDSMLEYHATLSTKLLSAQKLLSAIRQIFIVVR